MNRGGENSGEAVTKPRGGTNARLRGFHARQSGRPSLATRPSHRAGSTRRVSGGAPDRRIRPRIYFRNQVSVEPQPAVGRGVRHVGENPACRGAASIQYACNAGCQSGGEATVEYGCTSRGPRARQPIRTHVIRLFGYFARHVCPRGNAWQKTVSSYSSHPPPSTSSLFPPLDLLPSPHSSSYSPHPLALHSYYSVTPFLPVFSLPPFPHPPRSHPHPLPFSHPPPHFPPSFRRDRAVSSGHRLPSTSDPRLWDRGLSPLLGLHLKHRPGVTDVKAPESGQS